MYTLAMFLAVGSMASASSDPVLPDTAWVSPLGTETAVPPSETPGTAAKQDAAAQTARVTISSSLMAVLIGDLSLQVETRVQDNYAVVVFASGHPAYLRSARIGGQYHFRSFERGWFAGVDVVSRAPMFGGTEGRPLGVGPRGGWKITSESGVTFSTDLGLDAGPPVDRFLLQANGGIHLGYSF